MNTSTYQFQDEIGNILIDICKFVPHGILCFVPSYMLLDKLYERLVFSDSFLVKAFQMQYMNYCSFEEGKRVKWPFLCHLLRLLSNDSY